MSVGENPHADLVAFLEEQDRLNQLDSRPHQIFEPCIIIGDRSKMTIAPNTRIDSFTKFEIGHGMHIGTGVHIASFAHIGIGGGLTEIGDYAAVASGGKLISGSNQLHARSMSPLAPEGWFDIKRGHVALQNFACVLTNAIVCPGVTLGYGAALLPNSCATKDIPDWEVWGGSPAVFKFKRVCK